MNKPDTNFYTSMLAKYFGWEANSEQVSEITTVMEDYAKEYADFIRTQEALSPLED